MSEEFQSLIQLCRKPVTSQRDWRAFQALVRNMDNLAGHAMHLEDDDRLLLGASLGEFAKRLVTLDNSVTRRYEALALTTMALELVSSELSQDARLALLLNAGRLGLDALLRAMPARGEPPSIEWTRDHFKEALEIATSVMDAEGVLEASIGFGDALLLERQVSPSSFESASEQRSTVHSAIGHYTTALEYARALGDTQTRVEALNRLAGAWTLLADRETESIEYALDALEEAEACAAQIHSKTLMAQIAHNRALLRLRFPGTDEHAAVEAAIGDLTDALATRRRGAPQFEAETRLALATALMRRSGAERERIVDDAKRHLRKAIGVFRTLEDRSMDYASATMHLGNVYLECAKSEKDIAIAVELFQTARSILPLHAAYERALIDVNYFAGVLQLSGRLREMHDSSEARETLLAAAHALAAHGEAVEADRAATLAKRFDGDFSAPE